MNTESRSRVAASFGSRGLNRMIPSSARHEPATIASPSTSRAFANSEPRTAVVATTTSPAASANKTMKSSGRLPSVDCRTPVPAGPKRAPTASVDTPTTYASPESASPAATNRATAFASAKWSTPATAAATNGAPRAAARTSAGRSPSGRTCVRASDRRRRPPSPRPARAASAAQRRPRGARGSAPGTGRAR